MRGGYKLLLFDFDGTLVDTVRDITYYVNEVLAEHGCQICSVDEVKGAIGFGVHELLKELAPSLAKDPRILESAVELFKGRYREKPVRETKPFSGVTEMLHGPLSKTPKAIITNKPQDITLEILEQLKLSRHFELVIGMHAGYPPKPDPSSMVYAMRKLNRAPWETVYVGDSRVDAETAKNAKVDFAWVRYGYDVLGGEGSTYKFSSARDWSALVNR